MPSDPREYAELCVAKATEWITAKNRTGWLNKITPLIYHLGQDTDADRESAHKIAASFMGGKDIDNMLVIYKRHLDK